MSETIYHRYRLKRRTTAGWAANNEVLLAGEPGIEVLVDGTEKIKYGDGVKPWPQLTYAAGGDGSAGAAWLQGAGVPAANLGKLGDFYLRTSNGDVYGPKADTWGAVVANLASTVGIGTVTTAPAGEPAMVSNSGTAMDPVLDFRLPRGDAALLSSASPQPLGTPSAGTSAEASRADHRHQMPTAGQVGADASGTAAAAVAAHAAAADPHPNYALDSDLSTVATSGAYGDLSSRPDLSLKADLVNGLVPSSQLPGFVDYVVEFANLAAFPATGEAGKLYIALNTNKQYRWAGSTYQEIISSPGSTDAIPEGSVNLYHTTLRAAAAAPVQSVAGKTGTITLAVENVANAVATTDDRLSDARTPTAHNQAWLTITGTPTTLSGYGITDGIVVVNHGSVASTARPSGVMVVYWVGTVEPANGVDGDLGYGWL